MFKLWATILKDVRILRRDRVGLTFMFIMPVLLVLIVTGLQSGSFDLASRNKIPVLVCNNDTGASGIGFMRALDTMGMLAVRRIPPRETQAAIRERLHQKQALLAVVLPVDFSAKLTARTNRLAAKALKSFGLQDSSAEMAGDPSLTLYYHPVLAEAARRSVDGAIYGALQLIESRQLLRKIYFSINEKELPDSLERDLLANGTSISEVAVSLDGARASPTVSQHNVPAWAIFAMFFVVVSLGSGIVREKLNGSFIRLKTMPTSYSVAILSKQITYLAVTMVQTIVIFAVGIWVLPLVGLPGLELPADGWGLVLLSLLCGACAVSYAMCVGVFAGTEEQANGFGAVSIVILAAIGGLMVPDFLMTGAFRTAMKFSPLHWCLDAYYGLF
ncbi:MAG TPA: ABC transporter permease, partial [Puia sp.]|nr:ABC transporter permease [Puia sp.]